MSIVMPDDRMDGGESKTVPTRFGRKIRVEYFLQVAFGDTGTMVLQGNPYISAVFERRYFPFAGSYVFQPDIYHSTVLHRLVRIDDKVAQNLTDLPFVNINRPDIIRNEKIAFDVG